MLAFLTCIFPVPFSAFELWKTFMNQLIYYKHCSLFALRLRLTFRRVWLYMLAWRRQIKMPARGRNQEINEWNEECFAINFLMLCSFFSGSLLHYFCFLRDTISIFIRFHALHPETRYRLHFSNVYHLISGEGNKCLAVPRWKERIITQKSSEKSYIFPYAKMIY